MLFFIPRCRVPTGHVSDQGGRVSRTFKLQQKTYENILSQFVKITAGFSTAFTGGDPALQHPCRNFYGNQRQAGSGI
jgi:hypothetical protein